MSQSRGGPHRHRVPGGDAGRTLAEVVVGMALMGFCTLIFTPAVVHVFDWTGRAEAVGTAQSRMRVVLQRLDREIRYASEITEARQVGGDWYVEYRGDGPVGAAGCTRLRLSADGQLQKLSWTEEHFDAARPWTPLASGIAPPQAVTAPSTAQPSAQPFERLAAPDAGPDRLRVRVVVTEGGGARSAVTAVDFTFTALNSIRPADSSADPPEACQEGRPS
jgi:hypothetical protein